MRKVWRIYYLAHDSRLSEVKVYKYINIDFLSEEEAWDYVTEGRIENVTVMPITTT